MSWDAFEGYAIAWGVFVTLLVMPLMFQSLASEQLGISSRFDRLTRLSQAIMWPIAIGLAVAAFFLTSGENIFWAALYTAILAAMVTWFVVSLACRHEPRVF